MALKFYEHAEVASNRAKENNDGNAKSLNMNNSSHANSLRLKIQYPLESELTLIKVGEELENVEIIIENVGPGGLRLVSNIQLELDQEIIYSVESEFLEDKINIPGVIIWEEEISKDLFQYGVHFETPEQTRAFLNQLLGTS